VEAALGVEDSWAREKLRDAPLVRPRLVPKEGIASKRQEITE